MGIADDDDSIAPCRKIFSSNVINGPLLKAVIPHHLSVLEARHIIITWERLMGLYCYSCLRKGNKIAYLPQNVLTLNFYFCCITYRHGTTYIT